jgi:hypothetical protein
MIEVVDVEETELDSIAVVGAGVLVTAALTWDSLSAFIFLSCVWTEPMCVDGAVMEPLKLCAAVAMQILFAGKNSPI